MTWLWKTKTQNFHIPLLGILILLAIFVLAGLDVFGVGDEWSENIIIILCALCLLYSIIVAYKYGSSDLKLKENLHDFAKNNFEFKRGINILKRENDKLGSNCEKLQTNVNKFEEENRELEEQR